MTKILLSFTALFNFCIIAKAQIFVTGKIINAASRQPLEATCV